MVKKEEYKINIPKFPKQIIDVLEKNSYEAFIVGGCVRDELLNKKPSDYDITTNAKPEEIKKLFKRTIDTGIKHGTITVLFYENNRPITYEVTTYRIDGKYLDGRHPEEVEFVDDLREDLLRRDFTINAMAYNDERGLIDEFGGIDDLDNKLVRAVGNPIDRFTEDGLRLLRAIRFSAKLGFDIEKDTEVAIARLADNLMNVSKERVQVELTKTLTSSNPEYIEKAFELGLSKYICEGFEKIVPGKFVHEESVHLSYACLFYNTDIDTTQKILGELKFDNQNKSKIVKILSCKIDYKELKLYYEENDTESFAIKVKELISELDYDLIYDYIKLLSVNEDDAKLFEKLKLFVDECRKNVVPIFIKDLAIDGNDIKALGIDGKDIGMLLKELQKFVHNNSENNKKEILIGFSKEFIKNQKGA